MAECEDVLQHHKALDQNLSKLIEVMDPVSLLDRMIEINFDSKSRLRDIREAGTTSNQNREIIKAVRSKGADDYNKFLFMLKETRNTTAYETLTSGEPSNNSLQQHLIDLYKTKCCWVNPMTNDQEYIPEMYVSPAVKQMREKNELGRLTKVTTPSHLTYQHIFSSPSGQCTNIYITGDAGTGKTSFCNKMVLTWCKAVQNIQDETVSTEDLKLLSAFKFLFYIKLRNSETLYHVEDMIKEQLLCESQDISNLLKTEKCLIVLDGLDEWSCPDNVKKYPDFNENIPGRQPVNKMCVFLTTTRSWKFDVSDLKSKDVDKHVELCGTDENSSKELTQKMFDYLGRTPEQPNVDDFYSEIKGKNLAELITVPVLLIQLITLWHYGKDFGNSQIQLYSSMLDLLFERSEKKNLPDKQTESTHTTVEKGKKLPDCFSNKRYCQSRTELLMCLAQLAYESLFNKQKEESLVFKSETLEIFGISPSDIKLCLQCGLLSQNKDFGNDAGRYKKFSFLHKKMQEFLVALHIVTFDPVKNILKDLKEFCNTLGTMLEMSQVWLFVSGMRSDVTRQILKHLTNVITADTDKLIQKYRQTLRDQGLILDIQTFVTNCISEGESNGHKYEKIRLNDFYVDKDTFSHIERLLPSNVYTGMKTLYRRVLSRVQGLGIKSIYIKTDDMTDDQTALITEQLRHTKTLQKLALYDPQSRIASKTLTTLVDNCSDCLTCLGLLGGYETYSDNEWTYSGYNITLEHGAVRAICRSISKCLMSLCMYGVKLTHVDTVELLHKLSQSSSIRQLHLGLDCTDHDDPQCRPRIDVSTMTQLQTLVLEYMCVDNLPTVTQCMELVVLGNVTLSMTTLCEFARNISQTKRHVKVKLVGLTVREESEDRVDLKTFLRERPGLTVTRCEYDDSVKTWRIEFHTDSKT